MTIKMGLLNQLLGLFRGSTDDHATHNSPTQGNQTAEPGEKSRLGDRATIEYAGETFHCQVKESPNGQFQAAYADGR